MKFENPFKNLIADVYAQEGVDAVVSPSLNAIIDPSLLGTTTPTPEPSQTEQAGVRAEIAINRDDVINRGDSFDLDLTFSSGDLPVQSFSIVLEFNSNKLRVLESTYIDTYFVTDNDIDVDLDNGLITISGSAVDDARTVNRDIARINFTVESIGLIEINLNESLSQIQSASGTNIIGETNDVSFTVGQATLPTPIPTVSLPVDRLSDSSITDPSVLAPIGGGLLALVIGIWLTKLRNSSPNDELY